MNTIKLGLASYRITKLVLDDYLTEPLREKLQPLRSKHPKFNYFMGCPWCVSIYAGAATVLIEYTVPQVNTLLASSALTGIIYTNLG